MNTQAVVRGALAGMVGGMVMAMWSMVALWLTRSGFWQPLNLIAHTFWRGAPLDAKFSLGAALLGLVVHMMISMMVGVVFALGVQRIHGNLTAVAGLGMIAGIVIWVVMQYGVWRVVDADAAKAFTPWVFAVGHAMFGAATGLVVGARGAAPAERSTR
jgi:predicted permease